MPQRPLASQLEGEIMLFGDQLTLHIHIVYIICLYIFGRPLLELASVDSPCHLSNVNDCFLFELLVNVLANLVNK